jgi:hypothetical protein
MMQETIKEFEGNVWGPAIQTLNSKVEKNDGKTDEVLAQVVSLKLMVTEKVAGFKGMFVALGIMMSAPGLVWVGMQIYKSIAGK